MVERVAAQGVRTCLTVLPAVLQALPQDLTRANFLEGSCLVKLLANLGQTCGLPVVVLPADASLRLAVLQEDTGHAGEQVSA